MAKHVVAVLLVLNVIGALACNCPPAPPPGHPPKHKPPHRKPPHHKPPAVQPPHPPPRPPVLPPHPTPRPPIHPPYRPPVRPPHPPTPPAPTPTPPPPPSPPVVPYPPPTPPPVVPYPPPPVPLPPPVVPYPPPAPTPPATGQCPIDALKLGACVDLLSGLVHVIIGRGLKEKCCPVIQGLAGLDAALCLCTTIRAKLLNINLILPIALEALVGCGKSVPPGFRCPAPQ